MTELMTPNEAAAALKISIHTVRQWTVQRKLPVVRYGRKVLFRKEDIEGFIQKSRVESK
jgi:excisionase family DNA binding protein